MRSPGTLTFLHDTLTISPLFAFSPLFGPRLFPRASSFESTRQSFPPGPFQRDAARVVGKELVAEQETIKGRNKKQTAKPGKKSERKIQKKNEIHPVRICLFAAYRRGACPETSGQTNKQTVHIHSSPGLNFARAYSFPRLACNVVSYLSRSFVYYLFVFPSRFTFFSFYSPCFCFYDDVQARFSC